MNETKKRAQREAKKKRREKVRGKRTASKIEIQKAKAGGRPSTEDIRQSRHSSETFED